MEKKTLADTLRDLTKDYGKMVVVEKPREDVDYIPTGCCSLDSVFGCGGMPRGRILEFYGTQSSGKSVLSMFLCANIQKNGGKAAWIDLERCWTSSWARKIGVDTEKIMLFHPTTAEQCLDIVERLVASGEVDLIVVDSTALLLPEEEEEGSIEDKQIALVARIMSKGLRKITGPAYATNTTVLFLSQVRDKIGAFFGPSTDSTGGRALKFMASIRVQISKIKTLKDKKEIIIGNRLKIEITKNKVGAPGRSAEVDLYFDSGLDVMGDVFDLASIAGIISKEGNTFSYTTTKLGVGRDSSIEFLKDNEPIYKTIKEQVMLIGKDKDEKEIKEKNSLKK
jgi:recombination protein RecA